MLALQIKCKKLTRWHWCQTCCRFGEGVLGVGGVFRTDVCTYHREKYVPSAIMDSGRSVGRGEGGTSRGVMWVLV